MQKIEDVFTKTQGLLNEMLAEQQKIYDEQLAQKLEEEKKKRAEEGDSKDNSEDELVAESGEVSAPKNNQPIIKVKSTHIDDDAPQMVINVEPTQSNKPSLRKITEDAADAKVVVSGTIKKSYEEKTTETSTNSGLLKEAEGAVQKPTGRIIVK